MSTRAVVKIIEKVNYKKQPIVFNLYHHYDGYPEWLGKFLINELKDLGTEHYDSNTREWVRLDDACDVANYLIKHKEDKNFELTQYTHTDIEYLYEVDVVMRTITCKSVWCKNWESKHPKYTVEKVIDLEPYREKHIAELAK